MEKDSSPAPQAGRELAPRIDRDAAVARISTAYADDRISYEELGSRLDLALGARSEADLLRAVDSLPASAEPRAVVLTTMNGTIRRSGPWQVPRSLRIESEYGAVHLDLTRAVLESDVVELELQLPNGGATITVPDDARVDIDGLETVWKQPRYDRAGHAGGRGPLIRITGRMEYGRLRIRHHR